MEVSIRPYQESDLERVITIWFESWASTGMPLIPLLSGADAPERLRSAIQRVHRGTHVIYVACVRNEVVAFIIFRGDKLDQLFVDPRCQRQGIGKKLIEFARAIKPYGFWLHAIAANHDSNRFYQREGLQRGSIETDPESGVEIVRYEWKPTL